MAGLLYSTNVSLKYHIQETYFNNIHYVWCSEKFDSKDLGRFDFCANNPPSSNPADIYRNLKDAVKNKNINNAKIKQQILSFQSLAIKLYDEGKISGDTKKEIIFLAKNSSFSDWDPLIYVIPRSPVENRLKIVPIEKRASPRSIEYIISDLRRDEFDIIDPSPIGG